MMKNYFTALLITIMTIIFGLSYVLFSYFHVHAAEYGYHTDKKIEVLADQIYNYHIAYYCHNYPGSRRVTYYDVYFSSKYQFFGYVQDGTLSENGHAYKNIRMAYKNDDGDLKDITSSYGLRIDGVTITSYMAYSTYFDSNGEFIRDELKDYTTETAAKFEVIDYIHNDNDAEISFSVFDSRNSLEFYCSTENQDIEVPEDQIYDYFVDYYCHNYEGSRRVNHYEVSFSSKYRVFGYVQDGRHYEYGHEFKNIRMAYEDENGDLIPIKSSTGLRIDGFTITSFKCHSVFYDSDGEFLRDEFIDYTINTLAKFEVIDYLHDDDDADISFPVFDSRESLENYILTGDETGMIKKDPVNSSIPYDDTLPGVSGLKYNSLKGYDCHGESTTYRSCFGLSWDIPQSVSKDYQYCMKIRIRYYYNTYFSTSTKYGTTMIDLSEVVGVGYVPIKDGAVDICSKNIYEYLQKNSSFELKNSLDYVSTFGIHTIYKVYILPVYRPSTTAPLACGNWYVFNLDKDLINNPSIGDGLVYPGTDFPDEDGDFKPDTEPIEDIPKDNGSDKKDGFLGIDFSDVKGVLGSFYSILQSLMSALGAFPSLFTSVFTFLPYEIRSSILLLFYMAIIVGLLKIFT